MSRFLPRVGGHRPLGLCFYFGRDTSPFRAGRPQKGAKLVEDEGLTSSRVGLAQTGIIETISWGKRSKEVF